MPGLISNIFQHDEAEQATSQTTTIAGEGDTDVELAPSVGIGLSGSYEEADGTTHEWSNETEVGADIDLDLALATTTALTGNTFEASD